MRGAADISRDFLLDPEIAHLNHGSFGATPLPVLERQSQLRRELEAGPVEFLARRLPELVDGVRRELAAYVGAADPGSLVFVPNATTALNAAAASFPLRKGDEVLVTGLEYGAMLLMWRELAARSGARLVEAPIPLPAQSPEGVADAIWAHATPRTRLLFASHITSETALVLPIRELCSRARAEGITTVVDGAHGPGHVELELDAMGADCYAGNGHKWLCAPKGAAFLYARPEAREWLAPPVVSWGWGRGGAGSFQERFAWSGTDDPTAVLSLPAAIAYQRANGWPAQRERCRRLARRTQAEVLRRHGGERLAPEPMQAPQMVAFPIAATDAQALQRILFDRYRVEIPAFAVGGRVLLRLSVQAYVTDGDCERLLAALAEIAPRNAKSR